MSADNLSTNMSSLFEWNNDFTEEDDKNNCVADLPSVVCVDVLSLFVTIYRFTHTGSVCHLHPYGQNCTLVISSLTLSTVHHFGFYKWCFYLHWSLAILVFLLLLSIFSEMHFPSISGNKNGAIKCKWYRCVNAVGKAV